MPTRNGVTFSKKTLLRSRLSKPATVSQGVNAPDRVAVKIKSLGRGRLLMKRIILGMLFSAMLSLTLTGSSVIAHAAILQDKKPERPVEKPKDDKRNDPPKDDKRDGKKKPY
jgi:hypothetical protein